MKKLEDLEKKYKELGEEIERLKKEQSVGKWIPEHGESYYFIDIDLRVNCNWFDSHEESDKDIIKYTKIFKEKEEAQEYADYLRAKHDYAHESTKENWEDYSTKFSIYLDYSLREFNIAKYMTYKHMGDIYFDSEEKAQEFIDKYKKQILKFEFGIMKE